jgi:hypothetical protein
VTSVTQQLAPALDIDARLTEIERSVDLLLNVTPVNAAEAWADFERSDFGTGPTLRLRPLEFEPDLVRRDLYNLEIENVTDPALHTLFRTKRDGVLIVGSCLAIVLTRRPQRSCRPWARAMAPPLGRVPLLASWARAHCQACRCRSTLVPRPVRPGWDGGIPRSGWEAVRANEGQAAITRPIRVGWATAA